MAPRRSAPRSQSGRFFFDRASNADVAENVQEPAGEPGRDGGLRLRLQNGRAEAVAGFAQEPLVTLVVQGFRQVGGAGGKTGHLGGGRVRGL